MGVPNTTDFLQALRQHHLLEPAQLQEAEQLAARCPEAKDLAKALLQRGWLTTFQINQIAKGKAAELVLDQYLLLDLIGQGGMGAVYRAIQRRMKRQVAVKIVRPDVLATAGAVARFQREAETAARLSHPNIVTVHDTNEVNGIRFLVMEYVEGIDLSKLVKENGPMSVVQACDSVRQAALGLHHAHEQGLIHRDVKPANLILTKLGTIKVLDLGLARLNEGPGAAQGLTETGAVLGTADYIAPEQARNAKDVDQRADVYSLGCTLYYLLTGQFPFPGETLTEKLLKHQLEEAAPLEGLRPDLPAGLADLVRKLMAKRAADRPASAAEVAVALEPFAVLVPYAELPAQSVEFQIPVVSPLAASAPKRHIAGPLVDSVPPLHPLPDRRRPWIFLAVLAGGVFCVVTGATIGASWLLWARAPLPPRPSTSSAVTGPPTTVLLRNDPKQARVCLEQGFALFKQKKYDEAIAELTRAIKFDPDLGDAYFHRASAYFSQGDSDKALADLAEVVRLDPKNAIASFNRGTIFEGKGDAKRAITEYSVAIRANPGYAEALINRGVLYLDQQNYKLALADFEAILERNPRNIQALLNRSQVYVRMPMPDYQKALEDLDRIIDIDPTFATAYFNRSRLYTLKGDAAKAEADMEKYRRLTAERKPPGTR
jgi:serine/threonine protein kinase/Tfp pilus assembly protein PilF